jgi:hypothetical protein
MFNSLYKKVLERLPEGVMAFDKSLRVRYVNAAFCRAFFVEKKSGKGSLAEVLSCSFGKTCGKTPNCKYCAVWQGMQRTVAQNAPQTEEIHTTIAGGTQKNTLSVVVKFYPPTENDGLYLAVSGRTYQAEMEREMLSAQKVQQRLLPAGKQVAGVPYALTYVPCLEVGGDLADVYELDGQAYAVIADVSGKGLSAGMLSAFAKAALDRTEPDLGVALGKLNAKFNEVGQDEKSYITVAAARIDREAGLLYYAFAGHNAPILLKNREGIHEIEDVSPPISNWFDDAKYVERALPFRHGDTLVLLTDGVTECKSPSGELFGTERAESVLLQSRNAEDFTSKLKHALAVFAGGKYSDDITVLAFDL